MTRDELIAFYGTQEQGYPKNIYEFGNSPHQIMQKEEFNPPKKSFKPFFRNKELMKSYDESDFLVVSKEFLESAIEAYKRIVAGHYNNMLAPFFGVKNSIKDNDAPCEFLDAIKIEGSTIYKKLSMRDMVVPIG